MAEEFFEELVLIPVDVNVGEPEPPEEIATGRCMVCRSGKADEIEAFALNGRSYKYNAEQISRMYGIDLSLQMLRYHMMNHASVENAQAAHSMMVAARSLFGDNFTDEMDAPTAESFVEVALQKAFVKLTTTDELEVRSIRDAIRLVTLHDAMTSSRHKREMERMQVESADNATQNIEDYVRQMGYIMDALKETVPAQYLEPAILAAWKRGLGRDLVDLSGVPIYQSAASPNVIDMDIVVADVNRLGRPRTRGELESGESAGGDVPPE